MTTVLLRQENAAADTAGNELGVRWFRRLEEGRVRRARVLCWRGSGSHSWIQCEILHRCEQMQCWAAQRSASTLEPERCTGGSDRWQKTPGCRPKRATQPSPLHSGVRRGVGSRLAASPLPRPESAQTKAPAQTASPSRWLAHAASAPHPTTWMRVRARRDALCSFHLRYYRFIA